MSLARRNGRARTAIAAVQEPVRVAVYCRKSTDEGLDKAFSSLDAQREAGEAYVNLHRDEGWMVLPDRYDDGGFSGGNTNRPALQRLLADVQAGKIDCVVVHKYDRLSRSMLDFLQLLDLFKKRGVSFVSVSQRFDTSTPVGEMTLNILLSFAQFERQIIAERTKDKVHAARRRGRWTGGIPILGFDTAPEGGKLIVNGDEAAQARAIFEMYVENPSFVAVAQELNRRGWRRKSWTTRGGKQRQGGTWNRLNLRTLLTNPLYAGLQKLGDDTFPGEHTAIVPKALFQRVQRLMAENGKHCGTGARNKHGALLRGLIHCATCGTVMSHQWTRKGPKLYRYYTCNRARKQGWAVCPTKSVPAGKIERFVVDRMRWIRTDPTLRDETFRQVRTQISAQRRGLAAERKCLERDRAASQREVDRLVTAVAEIRGPAREALVDGLARAQERVRSLEARLREGQREGAGLATQELEEADLARALEAFDPVWDVLLAPERERILRLLVAGIRYDGAAGKLEISWRLAGFGELAQEFGGA